MQIDLTFEHSSIWRGGQSFSVTGHSLGGHLATALNLLRREDGTQSRIDKVVTFNSAGVGERSCTIDSGATLAANSIAACEYSIGIRGRFGTKHRCHTPSPTTHSKSATA